MMKVIFLKKMIFLIISIVIGILVFNKNKDIIIPSEAIRVRIIANSNSINDLYQKKKLKEDIKNDLYNLVKEANSNIEADQSIKTNLNKIKELISNKTNDFTINYGTNYFPKKVYKGVIYPEGNYQSLVITLGRGLGDNWWCVLYPPLCMIDEDSSNVDYQLLIKKLL